MSSGTVSNWSHGVGKLNYFQIGLGKKLTDMEPVIARD